MVRSPKYLETWRYYQPENAFKNINTAFYKNLVVFLGELRSPSHQQVRKLMRYVISKFLLLPHLFLGQSVFIMILV